MEGTEKLDKADEKVEGLIGKITKIGAVVAEGFAWDRLREFTEHQVELATELEHTAVRLGLTTQQVEQFNFAAGDAGISSQQMSVGIRFLNKNIAEAADKGGEAGAVFQKLGIHVKDSGGKTRSVSEIFPELADKIAATEDPAKRVQIAMQLLGRHGAALIPLLAKGSVAFDEANKAMEELGGTTSPEFIEQAKHVEEAQHRLTFGFDRLKQILAAALFPQFERLIRFATTWVVRAVDFARHTTLVKTGLQFLAGVALVKTVSSVMALVKSLGLLSAEFLVPLVGLALLYLAFDEFSGFLSGTDSVIGDTIDSFAGLGEGAATGAEMAVLAKAAWQDLEEVLVDIGKIAFWLVAGPFKALWDAAEGLGKLVGDIAFGNLAALKGDMQETGKKLVGDLIGNAADAAHDALTGPSHIAAATNQAEEAGDKARAAYQQRHQFDQFGPANGPGKTQVGNITFGPSPSTVFVPPSVAGAAGAGAAGHHGPNQVIIQQQNHFETKVQTSTDDPDAVGDAAKTGAATGNQKALNNAAIAAKRS